MSVLLRASEMRAAEERAIRSGRVNGAMLMERAGRGVFEAICTTWPEPAAGGATAAVLCGPGNNGGDGFVVARLLADLGWAVTAYFNGDPSKLPEDAFSAFRHWQGPTRPLSDYASSSEDIIVDALFGTGLARPVSGDFLAALGVASERPRTSKLVAVDVLSGFSSDSGHLPEGSEEYPARLRADMTVTFQAPRLGHFTGSLPARSGRLVVVPIGVELPDGDSVVRLLEAPEPEQVTKGLLGHKYGHGHALVLAGGQQRAALAGWRRGGRCGWEPGLSRWGLAKRRLPKTRRGSMP